MAAAAAVAHHHLKSTGSFKTSPKLPKSNGSIAPNNKILPESGQDATMKGITFFQRMIRAKVVCPIRLNRANLAERVTFENNMVLGTIRLLNQLTVFALLMLALRMSSSEPKKFGVHQDLNAIFDFAGLENAQSPGQFQAKLGEISSASKQFFHLSSSYFDSQGRGAVELLGSMETFTSSKVVDQLEIQQEEFTFTAWIETSPQFLEGNIIRKRPTSTGSGADLSCFSWGLHKNLGPLIKYGAHDFDPLAGPYSTVTDTQYSVGLSTPKEFLAGQVVMLTVVARGENVTFFQNLENLGTINLPRPRITDCHTSEGILLGDSSMTLGVVRYFPIALTSSTIEELFSAGSRLSDISRGSVPAVSTATQMDGIEQSVGTGFAEMDTAIDSRQSLSELTSLLSLGSSGSASTDAVGVSPEAPKGVMQANHTLVTDSVVNREYYQLIEGPYHLTRTTADADHRYIDNPPDFNGRGGLITFWYRHIPCSVETCGIWLFATKNDAKEGHCWSIWLENTAFYFDNRDGNPTSQYPMHFLPSKYNLNGNVNWRHLAVAFDDATDQVRYYVDGTLAWTGPFGSDVANADCLGSNRRMTVGRVEPGFTYGAEAEVFDLRMYPDPSGQGSLSDADILKLARVSTPQISSTTKCFPIDAAEMEDTDWLDTFEHSCEWYFQKRQDFPSICNVGEAAAKCPLSCKSKQECYEVAEETPAFFVWDRIRRIERRAANGTICLKEELSKEQVVSECRNWVATNPGTDSFPGWWANIANAYRNAPEVPRIDYRDCDMVEAAIDEECSFDGEIVKQFTTQYKANKGEFTIAFWVKPMGISSILNNKFFPHLSFFASSSPPQVPLQWGLWANPNGEARLLSPCDEAATFPWENVEQNAASTDDWTFLAITFRNATGSETAVTTNLGKDAEGSTLVQCLYDPENYFNHLEINYPMLISPIMLVPKALPFALTQELYLRQSSSMNSRDGPRVALKESKAEAEIEVAKNDFTPRSILVAPPILFQKRHQLSPSCSIKYSGTFIKQEHEKVVGGQCAPPFSCDEEILARPERVIACPGDQIKDGTAFGLESSDFNGENGFADFLFSWQDNPFLFRDGRLTQTSEFIDALTTQIQVILVFFTPRYGMTSVLTVSGDFSGMGTTETSVDLQHFEVIEGGDLTVYLVLQIIVLFNVAIMLTDIALSCRRLAMDVIREGELPSIAAVVKQLVDLGTAVAVTVFVAFRIPSKTGSASKIEEIVGGLSELQWDSQEITLTQKTSSFFSLLNELMDTIGTESWQNTFCVFILFVNLVRVIQCTALHPRLALLTGTLVKATDDLWHAILLVFLLMGCFAGIASWRFGSERHEFMTFGASMNMQFMMMFGEFPNNWDMNYEMQFYTFAYFIILFLLVQNFLLAIIVEAYMQVRTDNETMETEQEFVHDVYYCFKGQWLAIKNGWPNMAMLGDELSDWSCKISVGFRELWDTNLFRTQKSVVLFIEHYSKYDFLQPPVIRAYGLDNGNQDLASDIERRLAKLFIGHVPTLKEMADENIKAAQNRKKTKGQAAENGIGKHLEDGALPVDPPDQDAGGAVEWVQQWGAKGSKLGLMNHMNGHADKNGGPAVNHQAVETLAQQLEEQKKVLANHMQGVEARLAQHLSKIEKLLGGGAAGGPEDSTAQTQPRGSARGGNPDSKRESTTEMQEVEDLLEITNTPRS